MENDFQEINKKRSKHLVALIFALAFGALLTAPFIYSKFIATEAKDIIPKISSDQLFYEARIKDVMDGYPWIGNAYIWEHKNSLSQQLFLTEFLLAQPLKFFHSSLFNGRIIYNLILPAVTFLLAYFAFYFVSKSQFFANLSAIFLFFGLFLFRFFQPISPQFNFIFWLSQFIFLWLLIKKPKSTVIWLCNLFNFGLLFYVYTYYWTFYIILFAILAVVYFFNKNTRYLSLKILGIIGGGLALGSFYFYQLYSASQLPEYLQALARIGMINSHFPSGLKIVAVSAIVGLLFFICFRFKIISLDKYSLFFAAGILTSVIAVNQHVITGRNLEFSSHYYMSAVFFGGFACAFLWVNFIKSFPRYLKVIKIPFLIVVILVVVLNLRNLPGIFSSVRSQATSNVRYSRVIKWINENIKNESVVYANENLSVLIPVYTKNDVFYERFANLFIMPDTEVLDRFILNNFFENFDENFVTQNYRSIFGVYYIDKFSHNQSANKVKVLLGLKPEPAPLLPKEAVDKVITRARQLQKKDFESEISKYRVDYFVFDKKFDDWQLLKKKGFLSKVFENDDFIIYEPMNRKS